ncbi:hypothetical protein [Pedobacter hartonius]|uniref:Lipoprotein n=1 Tax=Pedobacter hartonius TaxID=425514 RepID=A0A1H4FR27_9SPHI|nr:hypothetical protein [Pedobacter hartonius]SEA99601.1 hypothetical protein SAMN05443550_10870 [Pedobacter hartonius]
MNKLILLCFLLFILFGSCAKTTDSEVEVYYNDFESGNLTGIENGTISPFNGSNVLGNYNNGEFKVVVNDLPKHDVVDISFDLYIHDSWEGSQSLQNNVSGPDLWQMKVNNKTFVSATFANFDCAPGNFCPGQSYPADYPTQSNNPKSGASNINLPGFCSEALNPNGSTLYKIHKSISHSEKTLLIQCLDKLVQKDVADPKCNESWSVDNIKIKVISLN